MVWSIVVSHGVSGLKGFKELLEDLLLGLLALFDSWVILGIIDTSNIIDINKSISVFIQIVVGAQNDLLSLSRHWTSDGSNELVKLNGSTVVKIKVVEELGDFLIIKAEHIVVHGLSELLLIKRIGSIVIHDFELSLETNESLGTSGNELVSKCVTQLLTGSLLSNDLRFGSVWSAKEVG